MYRSKFPVFLNMMFHASPLHHELPYKQGKLLRYAQDIAEGFI